MLGGGTSVVGCGYTDLGGDSTFRRSAFADAAGATAAAYVRTSSMTGTFIYPTNPIATTVS